MYLKRLDVQGFKSFANKTALDFSTGVTCIVGPNGCGKTNVADSLRWVLGEHASRTLRARKTEDVIFAGSDKRAPMGVAEVNITLDNAEQWLPVDFNEVVVTRRAYRDGENEYFINGSRVRLRDVVELFMRAQVGQNSYAFMGQGMVEQVLSLRPEDRRALIEEAAEVRLYRHRLEEAQSKLKATRENLDRVQLLVREIQPRITQLERQAGRALRYQELARELAGLLDVWYEHQWREVNANVLAALATHDQRAEEFEQIKTEVKACEDGLTHLRAAIEERRREISAQDARLRNLQDYARDLERRAALDGERGRLLSERLDELTAELASLGDDATAQAASSRPVEGLAERQDALDAARVSLDDLRARFASIDEELRRLQASALDQQHSAARAGSEHDDVSRGLAETIDAIARLQGELADAADERPKMLAALAAWAREYARLRDGAASAGERLASALAARTQTGATAERLAREQSALEDEVRGLRIELDMAQARIELLEKIDVTPPVPDAGVRAILEAGGVIKRESVADDVELSGVLGLVGQIIRVPPGLEKAIEAALAESLFGVVLQRESDVRNALSLLLSGDRGHATLYPLDSLQEVRPLHLMKERGVIGVASQLVRCESRYRRLIDLLLGRTVIVEDFALAQRVVRRGLASAVATRDGILLRPVGSVAAGSLATVQAAFTRERELDESPEQLVRLRPLLEERELALSALVERRAEAQALSEQLARDIEAMREGDGRAQIALSSMRVKLIELGAGLRRIDSVATNAARELASLTAARDELQRRSTAATAAHDAAIGGERLAREAISALEPQRASLAAAMDEQAATVAYLEGELRSQRQTGEGERIAGERLERQIAQKEAQREKLAGESHSIASRLAATQRELSEKNAEVDASQSELEPARRELSQLESRERTLSADLADAAARLRTAERAQFDAESDVRIRCDELESVRNGIEADGFVPRDDGEVERPPEPQREAAPEQAEVHAGANGDLPAWLRSEDGGAELPPIRGGSTINPTEVRDRIADLRAQIRSLGPVNEQAASDYEESRERYDFLSGQLADLNDAEGRLNEAIKELETVIRDRFRTTFKTVNREFERYFSAFFRGGTARLELGETDDDGLPGIDIIAQPPGKKLGSLALLSGGERSLTAVALLFALLQANPSPICVLDEVDAALDEANVGRFVEELRELSQRTQFIIITHNRRTIETADTIYGVSMGADSVSRVLSLRLADIEADLD